MPTSPVPQNTDFTRDVLGRYVCNGLDEALASSNNGASPRPFDVVVIGGGSFGPIFAQHLIYNDTAHARRALVLDAGRLVLSEHVQNLPLLELNVPGPTTVDPGVARAEVRGLPWRTDVPRGFPGLAYCLGGRSVYFGGWSPQLLASEMPGAWPAAVIADLDGPLPSGADGYFRQAAEQIGTTTTNDFIFGALHIALRAQLKQGIDNSNVTDAIPLAQLPLHLNGIPNAQRNLNRLEAPLAVQARPPRAGSFPFNKFSSLPLLMQTSRAAQFKSGGDDTRKRLMVVPDCHVTRLVTDGSGPIRRVVAVETNRGTVQVPEEAVVVLALGTIENARLALVSLPGLPGAERIGANLMPHLRSNLTVRLPRAAINGLNPAVHELQASALFVKGRHAHIDGLFGHFHLPDHRCGFEYAERRLRSRTLQEDPRRRHHRRFPSTPPMTCIVVTIRGIGEMRPNNPASQVTLAGEVDEFGIPRAFVSIDPGVEDGVLWDAMDTAADEVGLGICQRPALRSAMSGPALSSLSLPIRLPRRYCRFQAAGTALARPIMRPARWPLGDDPNTSVTNPDARFHRVPNLYVAGPALFPTVGSPNPMLTGTALARRLADHLATPFAGTGRLHLPVRRGHVTELANVNDQEPARETTIRAGSSVTNGALVAKPGTDIGLFWHTQPMAARLWG